MRDVFRLSSDCCYAKMLVCTAGGTVLKRLKSARGLLFFLFFTDENGKDQGINVRQKVKEMVEFVQDDDRLREERKKAKKNRDKYIGVSSDSMGDFRYCESCSRK